MHTFKKERNCLNFSWFPLVHMMKEVCFGMAFKSLAEHPMCSTEFSTHLLLQAGWLPLPTPSTTTCITTAGGLESRNSKLSQEQGPIEWCQEKRWGKFFIAQDGWTGYRALGNSHSLRLPLIYYCPSEGYKSY